jgi:putative glutamine amidotransferase
MKRPVIGITTSQMNMGDDKTNYLSSEYITAICDAGGAPILIPGEYPVDHLDEILGICDGILLSGGGDIDPNLYHGENHRRVSNVYRERDALECGLARQAARIDLPVLGICRGLQIMNVALGGTLYTHLPVQFGMKINHQVPDTYEDECLAHQVDIMEGTRLYAILNKNSIQVNSHHHQAIKNLAPELRVTARSSDGLIEGIEHPTLRYYIGVQWHPESIQELEEEKSIFASFIAAVSN